MIRSAGGMVGVVGLVVVSGALSVPQASAHPYGWRVGQTIEGNLTIDFMWGMAHNLNDRIPGWPGYADRDLAFEEFPVANPAINLYPLTGGGKIELVAVDFDPAVYLRDAGDLPNGLREQGDSWSIGSSGTNFMAHPWWHVDTTDAGFDPSVRQWTARFYLRDITGLHADSPVYTFKMIPAPGVSALFGVFGVVASRRRR